MCVSSLSLPSFEARRVTHTHSAACVNTADSMPARFHSNILSSRTMATELALQTVSECQSCDLCLMSVCVN